MSYQDIRPGTYTGTVTGTAIGLTGTGKEQVAIGFEVDVGTDTPVALTWYGFFHTEGSLKTTMKALSVLGFDMATRGLEELATEDASASPLVGQTANVVLDYEKDMEGQPRLKVKWVNRPGGLGPAVKERMDPLRAKAFANSLRGKVIAAAGGTTATATKPAAAPAKRAPAPKPAAKPVETFEDDIPF